jgi:pyruvate dehydrogenase E2 component (dihydrolipoamide acetyltransferase)
MEEGTIVKWHKKIGDYVEAGDLILEVATDKATVEHNTLDAGYLRKIIVPEGQTAKVNQSIAIFTEEKNENIENYKPTGFEPTEESIAVPTDKKTPETTTKETPTKTPPSVATSHQPAFIPESPLEGYQFPLPTTQTTGKRLKASPLAKKLAQEKQLDLGSIKGSGPHGRIISSDLDLAQSAGSLVFGRHETPKHPPGAYEEEPLSQIRKVIAKRLQESKTYIPHFYVQQAIDAQALIAIREQLTNFEMKVSFNDLIIRACAMALRVHPNVNSGYHSVNQTIIRFQTIDIAVAVSTKEGLITPIIRHADYKNVGEIAVESRDLARRSREGKLDPQEYKGGSFTISNLGMYGVTDFQAIINPPQAAILAVSAISDVPVVRNGQVVPGKVMNITLSVDHRVIDGAAAAEFINTLQQYLENPASLLI